MEKPSPKRSQKTEIEKRIDQVKQNPESKTATNSTSENIIKEQNQGPKTTPSSNTESQPSSLEFNFVVDKEVTKVISVTITADADNIGEIIDLTLVHPSGKLIKLPLVKTSEEDTYSFINKSYVDVTIKSVIDILIFPQDKDLLPLQGTWVVKLTMDRPNKVVTGYIVI